MKKFLLGLFLTTLLINLGLTEQDQNTPTPIQQTEAIALPITQAPVQTTPTQDEANTATTTTEEESKKPKPQKTEDTKTLPSEDFIKEKSKPKKVIFIQEEFYEPKKDEITILRKNQKIFLNIVSKELQRFMEGAIYQTKQQVQTFGVEDSFTQITNLDGKIYEYKYSQKSIDRYSAIALHQNYPLKKISTNQYQILIKKIPQIFDIKGCKIVIKKELSGTLNQTKEVIINLDTKRELRNKSQFDLFLECPK